MFGRKFIRCEDLIDQGIIFRIDIEEMLLVRQICFIKIVQTGEHGPYRQIVSVDHRMVIRKILFVVILGIDAAGFCRLSVQSVRQIISIVRCMLHDRIVHRCTRHRDPCINIRILRL